MLGSMRLEESSLHISVASLDVDLFGLPARYVKAGIAKSQTKALSLLQSNQSFFE